MDQLGDPLTTHPIQTGWEFTMEPYPSGQFGFIDDPDRQFGNGSLWTQTQTQGDGPEPLLTQGRGRNIWLQVSTNMGAFATPGPIPIVEPYSFTVAYTDPNIAGKRMAETSSQQFSWCWPGDDESILSIVTSILDSTILWIMNVAIASLPDPSWKIHDLWGCLKEPNRDRGLYAWNVTPIFDINKAAWWVNAAMETNNPTLFVVVYRGQQDHCTAGARMPMCGGCSNIALHILPPPAGNMIDNFREVSDNDAEMWHPYPRSFPTTKTNFEKFEWRLRKNIIWPQRYLEVIQNRALGLFVDY